MSNIINYTKFVGKLNLPQTGDTEGRTQVESFITEYETEYLKKALGYDLWKAFTTGNQLDQRWVDLLEGKEFILDGQTVLWPGFNNKPIQNYVYYKYLENEASTTSLVGGITPAADNSNRVNSSEKMVAAWNDMVELNQILWNFLYENMTVYPEWVITDPLTDVYRFKNRFDL